MPSWRGCVAHKGRPSLHPIDAEWIARSPMVLVATSATDGTCDVSPKGDPPGHGPRVLDARTLAIRERPGNKRPTGSTTCWPTRTLFLVPGRTDTLRVNGRARLVRDAVCFDAMAVQGRRPVLRWR